MFDIFALYAKEHRCTPLGPNRVTPSIFFSSRSWHKHEILCRSNDD